MKRVLTGLQVTGIPHLGNIIAALEPALSHPAYIFIADLHTLTSQPEPKQLQQNSLSAAATLLALGLDPKQHILYRQSQLPQVCELMWYLSCLTSYKSLSKAHAFKSKSTHFTPNTGLFTYPVLMAADILLLKATHVPVGKDQHQHMELAIQLAKQFNRHYGSYFPLPTIMNSQSITVPGTDGRKMSKSYNNTLLPLADIATIEKEVKSIQTNSTPLHAPKDPSHCPLFQIYAVVASEAEQAQMREHYVAGGYGYQAAKKALLDLLINKYAAARQKYQTYMKNPSHIIAILEAGEEKANQIASQSMADIRKRIGFSPYFPSSLA